MDVTEKYVALLVALLEDRNADVVRRMDKERECHKDKECEETYLKGYHDALIMVLKLIR